MPEQAVASEVFLVRSRGGPTGWQVLAPVHADIQVDARVLILGAPELLGPAGRAPFRAAMAAPAALDQPGRVLVAVEETGAVAIAACLDGNGTEAHQHLVADILWAEAMLWRRSYDDFSADFRNNVGTALEQLVGDKAGPGWSLERFRSEVRTNLGRGRFPVILIAAGSVPAPPDVADYLRSFFLAVTTLSLGAYRSGGIELVMPNRGESRDTETARPAETPRPVPEPVRPAESRPTPARPQEAKAPTQPPPAPKEQEEEPASAENPWARLGTKPGVMAGKRPPPDASQNKPGGSGGGKQ